MCICMCVGALSRVFLFYFTGVIIPVARNEDLNWQYLANSNIFAATYKVVY